MIRLPLAERQLAYRRLSDTAYTHLLLVFVPVGQSAGQAHVRPLETTSGFWRFAFNASLSGLAPVNTPCMCMGRTMIRTPTPLWRNTCFQDTVTIDGDPAQAQLANYDVATQLPSTTQNQLSALASTVAELQNRLQSQERPVLHVQHIRSQGVGGGDLDATWRVCPLNALRLNTLTGSDFDALNNQLTLPAGV